MILILQKSFKWIDFDDNNKRCNILIGDKGSINYSDISKIDVLNQQESFKRELNLLSLSSRRNNILL